jgi:hypothetical protein
LNVARLRYLLCLVLALLTAIVATSVIGILAFRRPEPPMKYFRPADPVFNEFRPPKPPMEHLGPADDLIDAMASQNKAPTISRTEINDSAIARFSPDFDWSDQDRVRKAIQAVQKDGSGEMWWRLRDYAGDDRYALTLGLDVETEIWNISVGYLCSEIAEANLKIAYMRHLPNVSGRMPFDFGALSKEDLKRWAGTPLYQLQIEVCERAIKQMASLNATESLGGGDYRRPSHAFTAEEKAQFTEAVTKQVEELKRTKKALTTDDITINGFRMKSLDVFNANSAERMRGSH